MKLSTSYQARLAPGGRFVPLNVQLVVKSTTASNAS
jgi:hypothetical protein